MRRRLVAAGGLAVILVALVLLALLRGDPDHPARARGPAPAPAASAESAIPSPAAEPPAMAEPPPTTPAPVAPTPALARAEPPEELPDPLIAIPGTRFEAVFPDWRPPPLPLRCTWRVVGFRETLAGCRRVGALPLGGPVRPQAYRTDPDPAPGAVVSIAVFLIARAYGPDGAPWEDRLDAHAAEAYVRADEIPELGIVDLRALAHTMSFTVRFEDAPPDLTAIGWFNHVVNERPNLSSDPSRLAPGSFPRHPEAFLDESGRLPFSGARLDAALDPMAALEITGWPRGLLWPASFELGSGDAPLGVWQIADPPLEEKHIRSGFDVDPRPATLHTYRRRPDVEMPPIEILGGPLPEGSEESAIVIASGNELSAEARISPRSRAWIWSVTRSRPDRDQTFSAVLLVPGMSPVETLGRTRSDVPLRFRLRPGEGEVAMIDWVVAPGLRTDIPIQYELELRCQSTYRSVGRALAEKGRYALPIPPRRCSWELEAEVDAAAWARRLEARLPRRSGRSIGPLTLRIETIGTLASGPTVLEVVVEHGVDVWPLAEFLAEFGIPP